MIGGAIDTVYLGAVPVRGKTEPMKLYTVAIAARRRDATHWITKRSRCRCEPS